MAISSYASPCMYIEYCLVMKDINRRSLDLEKWYRGVMGLGLAGAVVLGGLGLGAEDVSASSKTVKKASTRNVPVRTYAPLNESKKSVTKSGYTVSYDDGMYTVSGKVPSNVDTKRPVVATVMYGSGYKKSYSVKLSIVNGEVRGKFKAKQAYGDQAIKLDTWSRAYKQTVYVNSYGWYQFRIKDVNFAKKPSKYIQSTDKGIVSLAKSVTAGKKTDIEKSRAIYKYVATHVKYDVKQYKTGNAIFYSSVDTMKRKVAMCTGYANLSAAMHRAVGIEAIAVYGYANGGLHAWNEIHIGKSWYFQDPTFGAGYVDLKANKFTFNYTEKFLNVAYPKSHKKTGVYNF